MNIDHKETCATLPMYDWPEQHSATDTLWTTLRAAFDGYGLTVPINLDRTRNAMSIWTDPKLLFGQTCGLPFIDHLKCDTQILGIPVYDVEGVDHHNYSSRLIINRKDQRRNLREFQDSRLIVNDHGSQSGCNAVRLTLSDRKLPPTFFDTVSVSGSHRASIQAVAKGEADLCCIDPVSWDLAKRYDPGIVMLVEILDETPYTPNLPFICSNTIASSLDIDDILEKLQGAIHTMPQSCYETTRLQDIQPGELSLYADVKKWQQQAESNGHRHLARIALDH